MDLVRFIKWRLIVAFGQSSVKDYFTNKGIKVSYVDNINSKSFLKELRSLEPDVVLFVPFDKIAKDEFISIPNIGTYNLHLGKIPEYKGGFSSFWILRNLDKIAGVTMHEVVKEIDSGRIISEVRFNHDENSMKKLMELTVDKAADLILKSIESIQDNDYTYISIKDRETNYYLYPSRKDFKIFYQNGNKLI